MLLGLDFGQKRIGLALAEERGPAAPWKIIENTGTDSVIDEIKEIILEHNITQIVVGWPLSLGGKVTERTQLTDAVIKALQLATDVEVVMEDERLTSSIVTKATGDRKDIDDKSACEILQTHIDRNVATS
jgi:putative Holliday junction resolvase